MTFSTPFPTAFLALFLLVGIMEQLAVPMFLLERRDSPDLVKAAQALNSFHGWLGGISVKCLSAIPHLVQTGLYDYLQPWIRPQDAFEPLVNAYIYRGVLQKRNGSTLLVINSLTPSQSWVSCNIRMNRLVRSPCCCFYSISLSLHRRTTPDGGTFSR